MFNTGKKLTILAIGAHGDDIELACGGTLAKAIKNGHEVTMVLVSGHGSNDHKNMKIRAQNVAQQEAKAAATEAEISQVAGPEISSGGGKRKTLKQRKKSHKKKISGKKESHKKRKTSHKRR